MEFDFSGWATRNNVQCSDGRTIMQNAFKHNDGMTVPLVWNHQHNEPFNVLGHALLENRPEGVYAYGTFNETEQGQVAKELIKHGDVISLSIYANGLKQHGGNVEHGSIREVSLVLAGANPEAYIDSIMSHDGMYSDEEAIFYMQGDLSCEHSTIDDSEPGEEYEEYEEEIDDEEDFEPEDDELEDESEEITVEEAFESMTEEQQDAAMAVIEAALSDEDEMEHSAIDISGVAEVFETLDDTQKNAVYATIAYSMAGDELEHADGETIKDVFNTLSEKQKNVVYAMIGMIVGGKGGNEDMKHNVFDNEQNETVLSHADMDAIFSTAKRVGSLRDAVEQQSEEGGVLCHAVTDDEGNTVTYGIANIDYLFPDAQKVSNQPDFIKRKDEWVSTVMTGVHHTPFSRIKSVHADITMEEARARGYMKGNLKVEEVFELLRRTTTPQTIYKKQKLDKDDIHDITDFDVVAWLKSEMRMMLDEEIARAILVGDGRTSLHQDKINEANIRPIWKDADLYTIKAQYSVASSATDDQKAKAFIRKCVKARKDYRGSGNPVLFTTEDVVTDCLLMEDSMGRIIYDTEEKLRTALRVSKIVTVPVMEGLKRTVTPAGGSPIEYNLMGIIVNLNDYNVGADKGGSVEMFEDFDIDYNQEKYLIETRCSGAMIKPKSAIAVEMTFQNSLGITVNPTDGETTRYGKQVEDLQEGISIDEDEITGTLKYVTGYTGYSSTASEQQGNYLAFDVTVPAGATVYAGKTASATVENMVDITSDKFVVARITDPSTQCIKFIVTKSGAPTLTKILDISKLVLEEA